MDAAARLGANETSKSYGGGESSSDPSTNSHYNHPGVAITVWSGDSGYAVEYPGNCFSGWAVVGGTSASAPIIASVYALAGNASSVNYGSFPYSHISALNDVTSGSNGSCSPAYLRPTGPPPGWYNCARVK